MATTIRKWPAFESSVGVFPQLALDLISQGAVSLHHFANRFPQAFKLNPLASGPRVLIYAEVGGADQVRIEGRFNADSGFIKSLVWQDDAVFSGSEPVSGEQYVLSGGSARFNEGGGLQGRFHQVRFEDFGEDYAMALRGRFDVVAGSGRFHSAEVVSTVNGSGFLIRGDIRAALNGDGVDFYGTLHGLDILDERGEEVATARGLRLDAADFTDGPGSFDDRVIFAGNDNITLGDDGVLFRSWAGNDRIRGGVLGDTLVGGDGRDVLTGGDGADVYVFSGSSETTSNLARDVVTDFVAADDVIAFDLSVFKALDDTAYFQDGSFRFSLAAADGVVDYRGGKVYYDADGEGTMFSAMVVVSLAGRPSLGDSNFTASEGGMA